MVIAMCVITWATCIAVLVAIGRESWADRTPPDPCERRPRFRYRPPGS